MRIGTQATDVCGIAGVWGSDDRAVVRGMLDAIAHRGPDGEGVFGDAGVTLGHRRLAIIDIAMGQQPMTDHSGRYTIVYNGEVYNHLALRRELENWGHHFVTGSDTEVLLEAFKQWGSAMLERLEGMFAFALWDAADRSLLLARDPWGIKPLHYSLVEGGLAFASELKGVLAHPAVAARTDHESFLQQSVFKFLLGPATLLLGIQAFPPGHFTVLDHGHIGPPRFVRYGTLPAVQPNDLAEATRLLRHDLGESVREQLMSEVPVGVVLSGGLDSSAIAALQQKATPTPIHTFTVGESAEVPDVQMAAKVAAHIGSVHHETTFDAEAIWKDFAHYTWHGENIDYTVYFFEPLFALMRRHVGVGLCGQGADELWGGYSRYRDPAALAALRRDQVHRLQPRDAAAYEANIAASHASPAALCTWDQGAQLENYQLRLVDRHSMRHGLEVRVPFLSRPQQALSRGTPWDWKVRGGIEKWVLRQAVADLLPAEVALRPKVGAGRATGPGAIARFEAMAERQVVPREMAKHPLAATFKRPAKYLAHRVWEELFLHGADPARLRLEDIA